MPQTAEPTRADSTNPDENLITAEEGSAVPVAMPTCHS
jgi:hypothetical protein